MDDSSPALPRDSRAAHRGRSLGGGFGVPTFAFAGAEAERRTELPGRVRAASLLGGDLRLPRLVRLARPRADAEGSARRRRVVGRVLGADARVPPAPHRPLSERGPDGDARGRRAAAAPPGACRRRPVRPAALAPHGLLPAAARRSRTSSGSCSGRSSRSFAAIAQWFVTLFRGTPPRGLHRFLDALRPLPAARLRVPHARRESVPRLRRPGGRVSARPRGRASPRGRTAGRPASGSSSRSRRSIVDTALGGALLATARPDVVLRARHGPRRSGGSGTSPRTRCGTTRRCKGYLVPAHGRYPHASPLEGEDAAGGARTRAAARGARRPARRSRGGMGRRRVAALALVAARRTACRTSPRRRSSRRACSRRRGTTARSRGSSGSGHAHAARRARRLRPLRRPLDARVGGRAGRHRDAARDDRLRARLGGAAAVRGARGLVAPSQRALDGSYVEATLGNWLALGVAVRLALRRARRRDEPRARAPDRRPLVAARRAGLRRDRRPSSPSSRRGCSAARTFHAPYVAQLERIEHVHVPVRVHQRLHRAERVRDRARPEPPRLPLEADRRAAVHAARGPLRARARARPSRAQPHLEVDRLVRALRLPARVPPRARRAAARRDGRARGGAARDLRVRRPPARRRCRCRTSSRGTWRRRRTGRRSARRATRRRAAALPALRGRDEGRPEPAVVGLRLPREPPDAAAADRDDAVLDRAYAAAQSP